jgi:hypothetical protein
VGGTVVVVVVVGGVVVVVVVEPGVVVVVVVLEVGMLDVDDDDVVGRVPAVIWKAPPSTELDPHTTRVALAPAGLEGRGAVEPEKKPPVPDTKGVELSTGLLARGPEWTSNAPLVPWGQSVTTKVIDVPAGPWFGKKFKPRAAAGVAVKATRPRMAAGSSMLTRFVIACFVIACFMIACFRVACFRINFIGRTTVRRTARMGGKGRGPSSPGSVEGWIS